jgi:DNA-binding Xre family transcriptional regulator
MKISYKKLWKLLIDRNIKKTKFREIADISGATIAKMNKGEHISTRIIVKICEALDCDICDIMEIEKERNK